MATETPRDDGAGRSPPKGRLAVIAGAIATVALIIANVDTIWTIVSDWFSAKHHPYRS